MSRGGMTKGVAKTVWGLVYKSTACIKNTSLLSSLPMLLDESHLTDVTLATEGKTLRAHRVVLSACSSFFFELFRTLDSSFHPVVVIPGASFASVVALLTFMYSGEVNVFEGQIPSLISLAETLGIKGLADFQTQNTDRKLKPETDDIHEETEKTPRLSNSYENFFIKSLQFYPNLITQPLNFSQEALNKTSEIFTKHQQCNLLQKSNKTGEVKMLTGKSNKTNSQSPDAKSKEIKKIHEIVESLRNKTSFKANMNMLDPTLLISTSSCPTARYQHESLLKNETTKPVVFEDHKILCTSPPENFPSNEKHFEKTSSTSITGKIPSTKLYATCFICQKQLSNQYNLRVHLETHQNVRYACNVCSHVSRSKDALRKHVSYRHPGTHSPCETESRKKRTRPLGTSFNFLRQELSCLQESNTQMKSPNQQPLFKPANEDDKPKSESVNPFLSNSCQIEDLNIESSMLNMDVST